MRFAVGAPPWAPIAVERAREGNGTEGEGKERVGKGEERLNGNWGMYVTGFRGIDAPGWGVELTDGVGQAWTG